MRLPSTKLLIMQGLSCSIIILLFQERPPSVMEKIIEDTKLDLNKIPWIFLPNKKKSLVQLFHSLHGSIDALFALPMVRASVLLLNLKI